MQTCLSRELETHCFHEALASIGVRLPYGDKDGYWALKDGNPMLAAQGKQLVPCPRPETENVGRYIVHSDNHFMGMRVHIGEANLHDRRETCTADCVDSLHLPDHARFFKLCSLSLCQDVECKYSCIACKQCIMGTAIEQKGEGPYHFGCICHSDPWCNYYSDDVFGRGKTSPRGCLDGGYNAQSPPVRWNRHVQKPHHVQDLPHSLASMRELLCYNLKTAGGGDCAVHAAFGDVGAGAVRCPRPRALIRGSFGETATEFETKVGNACLCEELKKLFG